MCISEDETSRRLLNLNNSLSSELLIDFTSWMYGCAIFCSMHVFESHLESGNDRMLFMTIYDTNRIEFKWYGLIFVEATL